MGLIEHSSVPLLIWPSITASFSAGLQQSFLRNSNQGITAEKQVLRFFLRGLAGRTERVQSHTSRVRAHMWPKNLIKIVWKNAYDNSAALFNKKIKNTSQSPYTGAEL